MKVICELAWECKNMECQHRLPHDERKRSRETWSYCNGWCGTFGRNVPCECIDDEEDIL